jgi:hypothetical protein
LNGRGEGRGPTGERPAGSMRQFERGRSAWDAGALLSLQRSVGNQAVLRLLEAGTIEAKLSIGQPGDPNEIAAGPVAVGILSSLDPATLEPKCFRPPDTSSPERGDEIWSKRSQNSNDQWRNDNFNLIGPQFRPAAKDFVFRASPPTIPSSGLEIGPKHSTTPALAPPEGYTKKRIATAAKGAAVGAITGLFIGSIAGAIVGGADGNLVAPGVGTIPGCIGGALGGAEAGVPVGTALGVAVGALIGWLTRD